MGTAESKVNHRHRSSKYPRHKHERSTTHKCHHKNKHAETLHKGKSETIAPLVISSPLNPRIKGSIINSPFPMQRSFSEIQISPYEPIGNLNEFDNQESRGVHDYEKEMQRVDEENRPVLEGLCPDKMYVSTNDLRICDTQRLPPPLRCKITQGFFRPIDPSQIYKKKTALSTTML